MLGRSWLLTCLLTSITARAFSFTVKPIPVPSRSRHYGRGRRSPAHLLAVVGTDDIQNTKTTTDTDMDMTINLLAVGTEDISKPDTDSTATIPGDNNNNSDDDDDLTKEELALRFTEVLDYYQRLDHPDMSPEMVGLSMVRTRLPNLRLNRCVVAESTIPEAGLGVFASRDVATGELLTLFPGDALLEWTAQVGAFGAGVGVRFGDHIIGADRDASRVSSDSARLYEVEILQQRTTSPCCYSIVADPRLVGDPAYLGHIINDGACLSQSDNASRTLYSRYSFDRHNAAFYEMEGCHLSVEATKDIEKGEEIFVSYGEGYWLSRSETATPATGGTRGVASRGRKANKKGNRKGGGGFA
jgi:hypothetical protein